LRRAAAGGSLFALILGLAGLVTASDGLISRKPEILPELQAYAAAAKDWKFPEECYGMGPAGNLRPCRLGKAGDRGTLFVGDSFAMVPYGRFAGIAQRDPESSFTFLASLGCPPVIGMRFVTDTANCSGFMEKALQFVEARNFKRLVLAANWYQYFNPEEGWMCFETQSGCLRETRPEAYFGRFDAALAQLQGRLRGIARSGTEIVIIGATPSSPWNIPAELAKRKFAGLDTSGIESIARVPFEQKGALIKSRLIALAEGAGGQFIDPLEYLCEDDRCPAVGTDGLPYFMDGQHYRSSIVQTARFRYLDDAAGVHSRLSAAPAVSASTP
ncbi:MAG TPA: SGNH hydrolase domain-containing protein, partial [Methylocella sp.]|nr:SGNH hydrolase domain-containing protein [Methylocella sp.]